MSEAKVPTAAAAMPVSAASAAKGVVELKVSGHLMTFDAGIYCIFNPPGSPVPDPATGLPGVRVSLPPGQASHPEAMTISTFREDGWLGGWNGAALVRVARGPSQLLVTIYQLPNHTGEAPKLQILRLVEGSPMAAQAARTSGRAAAPAAPVAAAPVAAAAAQSSPAGGTAIDTASAEVVAHIQTRGDVTASLADWVGTPGSKHWIEGFALSPKQTVGPDDIEYQAVLGRGWLSPWAEGGQFCGSRGMSLPILGLRVRLRGDAAESYDCAVAATFVDGTEIGPLDNGEPCQSESLAPLEAFRIELRPRGAAEPAAKKAAAKAPAKPAAKPASKGAAKRK